MGTVSVERLGPDPLLMAEQFDAQACHIDSVTTLPPDAVVLARSEGDPHQCLRFAPSCYGVQFHPEFEASVMRTYIHYRADQIRSEGLEPERLLAATTQTPAAAQLLSRFVERFVLSKLAAP